MPVLLEFISVVVKVKAIHDRLEGGWPAFEAAVPNQTLCTDGEIARVGFMSPRDTEAFVRQLTDGGLTFEKLGRAWDIAVVDELRGPTLECPWLELGKADLGRHGAGVPACRLQGSSESTVRFPKSWMELNSVFSEMPFKPRRN